MRSCLRNLADVLIALDQPLDAWRQGVRLPLLSASRSRFRRIRLHPNLSRTSDGCSDGASTSVRPRRELRQAFSVPLRRCTLVPWACVIR